MSEDTLAAPSFCQFNLNVTTAKPVNSLQDLTHSQANNGFMDGIPDTNAALSPENGDVSPVTIGKQTAEQLSEIASSEKKLANSLGEGSAKVPLPQTPTDQNGSSVDPNLVRETRLQIRVLVKEISQLAMSDVSVDEFFDGFLTKVTSALASVGGVVWRLNDEGRLDLQYQINMKKTGLSSEMKNRAAHDLLLKRMIDHPEPQLVGPQSGTNQKGEPGNPTDQLIVMEALRINQRVVGVVEVFQRSGSGPATQRGYLRFLVQMCEIASDFLRNHRLRLFNDEQELWEKLETFIRDVHSDLSVKQTEYTVANEGRRLIDCDRVTVLRQRGRKCEVKVVSGLDSIERRAADIKLLNKLSSTVVKARQPLWFSGDGNDLSPQIEKRLQAYLDKSHSKMLAVIPLFQNPLKSKTTTEEGDNETRNRKNQKKQKLLGAIVVEKLGDSKITETLKKRVNVVVQHSQDALTNASRYDNIFLRPLWEKIGSAKRMGLAAIPVWALIPMLLLVGIFALFVTPYRFKVGSEGKLTPHYKNEIFAPMNGTIDQLYVPKSPKEIVEKGTLLAKLSNEPLDAEIDKLVGENKEVAARIQAIDRILESESELKHLENIKYYWEKQGLLQKWSNLKQQIKLKNDLKSNLVIISPASGQVVTWQYEEKLMHRPVKLGDNLMTIIDPNGPWELELEMPEKKMGHLLEAKKNLEELNVTFVVASAPKESYSGKVIHIAQRSEVRGADGNTVLVRVEFDKSEIPKELLLEGTRVTAQIHCGTRSIGYVMFHEVIETFQKNVLFWIMG